MYCKAQVSSGENVQALVCYAGPMRARDITRFPGVVSLFRYLGFPSPLQSSIKSKKKERKYFYLTYMYGYQAFTNIRKLKTKVIGTMPPQGFK